MAILGDLDERKAAVLRAIVSHYIASGEPAGSKTIAQRFRLGVSPATVRNDMGTLEDAGYIYQPHTSAGRVPTDAGYRYFVDVWGGEGRLDATEARRVRRFFGEPRWALEDALRETAALLSDLTDHAAVVFAPALGSSAVRHFELVALGEQRAMMVVVTDTGRVENFPIQMPATLDDVLLLRAAEMVNRLVVGLPLEAAAAQISKNVERFPLELRDLAATIVRTLSAEMSEHEDDKVFLEGTSNIVDEHKFSDLETVRQVIEALEHRRLLLEVVADALAAGSVSVRIGSENPMEEMHYCSVITAPYRLDAGVMGSLGVVGPTRMDYRRTIAAVHEVASNLGRMLSEL